MLKPQCQNFCGKYYGWICMANGAFNGALKIFVGIWANSQVLVADGFQSLTSVITAFITLISLRVSRWPKDETHPYGHGNVEFLMSAIFGFILLIVALVMIIRAVSAIAKGNLAPPLLVAIGPALISIISNISISRFGMCVSRQIHSPVIAANAENMSDALSSTATLLGIIGARVGYPVLDPLAAVLVALLIARIGVRILKNATDGLMDRSVTETERGRMLRRTAVVPGVQRVAYLKARQIGQKMWVDVGIVVPGAISLYKADRVAREVRSALMRSFSHIQDAVIYLENEPPVMAAKRGFWSRITSCLPARNPIDETPLSFPVKKDGQ